MGSNPATILRPVLLTVNGYSSKHMAQTHTYIIVTHSACSSLPRGAALGFRSGQLQWFTLLPLRCGKQLRYVETCSMVAVQMLF